MYGEEAAVKLPLDRMLASGAEVPAAEDVSRKVAEVVRTVRENMLSAQRKMKAQYDKRHCNVQF